MPMDNKFTPYFFQYTYYAGREQSSFISSEFTFENDYWLSTRIGMLIEKTPELSDELIKAILKKANVY